MLDVYLPRRAMLIRTLVWSVAMTAWLQLAAAVDLFGWYDEDEQSTDLRKFLLGVVIWFLMTLGYHWFRARREREAVGPRFDTDREAMRQALRTAELPADETLDAALLTAVGRRPHGSRGGDTGALIVVVIVGIGFCVGLALSDAPWLAVVALALLAVGVVRGRRRVRRHPRTLDDLEADLRARLAVDAAPAA